MGDETVGSAGSRSEFRAEPVTTENSVHARLASLRGCGFPSAGYARDGVGDWRSHQESWELVFVTC